EGARGSNRALRGEGAGGLTGGFGGGGGGGGSVPVLFMGVSVVYSRDGLVGLNFQPRPKSRSSPCTSACTSRPTSHGNYIGSYTRSVKKKMAPRSRRQVPPAPPERLALV